MSSQPRPKPKNHAEEITAALDWIRPRKFDSEGYPDVQVDLTRPSVSRDEAFAILSRAVLSSPAVESAPAASLPQAERDFFLRWIAEARRSMTREAHEDGRTEGEIIDDLGNTLANFGADSFTEEPEQVAEHDRLLALPRTYSLPPSAPAADAGIVARLREEEAHADRLAVRLQIAHQAECPTFDDGTGRCVGCGHQEVLDEHAARRGGAR